MYHPDLRLLAPGRVALVIFCTNATHVFSRDFQCNISSIKIDKMPSAIMYFLLILSLIQLLFSSEPALLCTEMNQPYLLPSDQPLSRTLDLLLFQHLLLISPHSITPQWQQICRRIRDLFLPKVQLAEAF